MSGYRVLSFHLRVDIDPTGAAKASLFDADDVREERPIAEATGKTAEVAVAELISDVPFNLMGEDEG